ncbi:MAG: hypothetical protein ACXVBE_15355, partial [Bdellovibrionota bacterium]
SPSFEWVKTEPKPSIRYPAEGMIVAFDPDISAERQRIPLEVEGAKSGKWKLNGESLGEVSSLPVKRGKYALSLLLPNGKEADSVHFEVR